jgi:hypothetical protein
MGPRACGQQRSITVPRGQSEPQLNGLIGRMNSTDRIWPESGRGYDRSCRARPADRSLVAEDRSAGGVRDRTGPEPAGTRWVHAEPAGRGLQRARAVTTEAKEPQLRPPAQPRPGNASRGGPEFESPHLHSSASYQCCADRPLDRRRRCRPRPAEVLHVRGLVARQGTAEGCVADHMSEQIPRWLLLGALIWGLRLQRILQDQPCSLRYRLFREDLGTHG